ncbi:sulfite exporter TauE/SafE family protein [Thiohalocapsa marina]|uniref:Probable membrane transporter protein n=1 Tax=Thiohalocapsa marina TaxID=424902 RepID=A0A5M8FHZ5_9GAMM|nr:sulfite exporter TauE/SafE family protein [Thiohalocapsa marina]KAA6183580.1 sulfite exporter TauE/SafE family protein [Thiohalocapsa marina]
MDSFYLIAFVLIGVIAGLLAGLFGIGGGAIIVPALILLFTGMGEAHGMTADWIPHLAVATSLATVVGSGSASAWTHHRRGAVQWPMFASLVPGLLIGAALGASFAPWLPAIWLQRLFALFLLYNGVRMLFATTVTAMRPLPSTLRIGAAASGIGALSALVGIGGGILIVPFLARHGVAIQRAVATSSACGVPLAIAGSIGFMLGGLGRDALPTLSVGFIYWPAALAIMLASVPMATVGARLAHRLPTATLKRFFGVLLLGVGLRLLVG